MFVEREGQKVLMSFMPLCVWGEGGGVCAKTNVYNMSVFVYVIDSVR